MTSTFYKRTSFRHWVPLALVVRSNPENDELPAPDVNFRIRSVLEDTFIQVRMTVRAGEKDSIEYEVDLMGVWDFEGDAPQPEEVDAFIESHALPRITAAINAELNALGSRVKRPYPNLPDNISEL